MPAILSGWIGTMEPRNLRAKNGRKTRRRLKSMVLTISKARRGKDYPQIAIKLIKAVIQAIRRSIWFIILGLGALFCLAMICSSQMAGRTGSGITPIK